MKQLLWFTAAWCGPCQQMKAKYSTLPNVDIKLVDIDDETNAELMRKYNIRSVPTFVLLSQESTITKTGVFDLAEWVK